MSRVGKELYLKFFRNYTRKQWNIDPSELDASVTARVPTRASRDGRYFTDTYQAMPQHGYTRMFERMLAHPNIKVLLNADHRELVGLAGREPTVYTGPIDEFFGFRHGKLPYRSLDFRFETYDTETLQPGAVVNYPNEHPYTRSTEFKYLTGQSTRGRRSSTSTRLTTATRTTRFRVRRTRSSMTPTAGSLRRRRTPSSSGASPPTATTT